jgi:hypothetical protein
MAGIHNTRKPQSQGIILNQDHELTYCSKRFGVARDRRGEPVAKAAPMVKDLRQ